LAIEPAWLPGEALFSTVEISYDPHRDRVLGRRRLRFEDLVIEEAEIPVEAHQVEPVLRQAAQQFPERALPWQDSAFQSLQRRLGFLQAHAPELGLRPFEAEDLWPLLDGLLPGHRSLGALAKAPWLDWIQGLLGSSKLRTLEEQAPERWRVPSGRQVRLDYGEEGPPILAVRIQEVFGLAATPRLVAGRVPMLLHLLAPNGRPQQITQDLASFWSHTYREVRKELKGRYPKHSWPENPLQAPPESRPQRRT